MNRRCAIRSTAKWSNLLMPIGNGIFRCRVSGGVDWVCAEITPSEKRSTPTAFFKLINRFLVLYLGTRSRPFQELSLFVMRIPAQAEREGGLVVFSLRHVLRASVIETEKFVVHVLPGGKHAKTFCDVRGPLGIHLGVRVEVVVAVGAGWAKGDRGRSSALILIGIDVGAVVRYAHGDQGALGGIGRPDIPGERCLSDELRRICAVGQVVVPGICVGEVSDDSRSPENSGQAAQMLLISQFDPLYIGMVTVHFLLHIIAGIQLGQRRACCRNNG